MSVPGAGPGAEPSTNTVSDRYAASLDDSTSIWQFIAIAAMVGSAAAIGVTRTFDLCSSIGPIVLTIAWVVLPVLAIASIAATAATTSDRTEQIVAITVSIAISAAWIYALLWASVPEAILRTSC